jgi:hypothetical protein
MLSGRRVWVAAALAAALFTAAAISDVGLTATSWAHPGHEHGDSDSGGGSGKSAGPRSGQNRGSSETNGTGASKGPGNSNDTRTICPDQSGTTMPCPGKRG